MNRFLKFTVLLFISFSSFGQEKGFYDVDNSYHHMYKKHKVKSLNVYTKEYDEKGTLNEEYLESITNFDTNGNIIREKEFYDASTAAWEIQYMYNSNHQLIKLEWTWLDDKDQEMTEFEYDAENKLIKTCNYYKSTNAPAFNLEECKRYHYKNNRISKVTNLDNDITSYYTKKGDTILGFSGDKKLENKYLKGEAIYLKFDSFIYHYERNKIGQLLKTTKVDHQKNVLETTIFEYYKGLLTKVKTVNKFGAILITEEYQYEYYE